MLIGMSLPGTLLRTDATTSYMGSDLSISDGLLVYTPQPTENAISRDGHGYVGIGLSNVNAYLLSATPNLGIAGTVRIKGAVSNIENVIVTSNSPVEVDWRTGNNQRVNLTAAITPTFTFVPPNGTSSLTLQINYLPSTSYGNITWQPADKVKWPNNSAPYLAISNSAAVPRFIIIHFFYEAGRGVYYAMRGVTTQ